MIDRGGHVAWLAEKKKFSGRWQRLRREGPPLRKPHRPGASASMPNGLARG